MRALIYCRVSKDKTGLNRSVDEQEAECRSLCKRQGWEILDVLIDSSRSASRYAKRGRPGWDEAKHRIASGVVDVLVTWEASRNQRDLADFVELRDLCRAHGVLLSYSGRVLDLGDSRDSFQAGLDALLAEDEAERTRTRILRTMRAQAEKGRPHGRRLYGYQRVYDEQTGALIGQVPHPDEAPIVREVARRIHDGESAYAIAEDLNARAVAVPTGASWSETRIKRMVTNRAYVAQRVHRGEVVGEADWSALLDFDVFESIAHQYASPDRAKYGRGGRDLKHLLSGIAKCGKCGAPMYVGGDRGRPVYICRAGKGHLTRSQEHLEAFLTAVILERLRLVDLGTSTTVNVPEAREARTRAVELRERLDSAVSEFAAGRLTAATLAKIEADLLPKISEADEAGRVITLPPIVANLAADTLDASWDALNIEQRRALVRLLANVTVLPSTSPSGRRGFDPERVQISWKF